MLEVHLGGRAHGWNAVTEAHTCAYVVRQTLDATPHPTPPHTTPHPTPPHHPHDRSVVKPSKKILLFFTRFTSFY